MMAFLPHKTVKRSGYGGGRGPNLPYTYRICEGQGGYSVYRQKLKSGEVVESVFLGAWASEQDAEAAVTHVCGVLHHERESTTLPE